MPAIDEVSLQRFPRVLAQLQQTFHRTAAKCPQGVSYFQGESL
jgi:hypothetical protein